MAMVLNKCKCTRTRLTKTCVLFLLLITFYSPNMPENEATFAITAGGIADGKEWLIKIHIASLYFYFNCTYIEWPWLSLGVNNLFFFIYE